VNQHTGICGCNPNRDKDPVLGEEHPTCTCSRSKHFNGTPPLSRSGASIACEMNKFDAVMHFLVGRDATFAQVIAVDARFDLFSRAWCVGELAEARRMRMPQALRLRSGDDLKDNESKLRGLKVEGMKASRPEDVEEILAKIPDKTAFNVALQELIFDDGNGLLAAWRERDAERQMCCIGRIMRWEAVGGDAIWRNWSGF